MVPFSDKITLMKNCQEQLTDQMESCFLVCSIFLKMLEICIKTHNGNIFRQKCSQKDRATDGELFIMSQNLPESVTNLFLNTQY